MRRDPTRFALRVKCTPAARSADSGQLAQGGDAASHKLAMRDRAQIADRSSKVRVVSAVKSVGTRSSVPIPEAMTLPSQKSGVR